MVDPKMTIPTQLVLRAMLEHPTRELYGSGIASTTRLSSGTVHPILVRLEQLGWAKSRWEDADPAVVGRPRRRYYQLTPAGTTQARRALAAAHTKLSAIGQPAQVYGGRPAQ